MITATRLRELLAYDPATGLFTWAANHGTKCRAGEVAGSDHGKGYIQIQLDGRNYLAHRLAWLYVTGEWPSHGVDHKHGNRSDNRWDELRAATNSQNQQNLRKARSRSLTGLLGVSRNGKRWKSNITLNGVQKHIGTFDTPEQAHAAYIEVKRQQHEHNML